MTARRSRSATQNLCRRKCVGLEQFHHILIARGNTQCPTLCLDDLNGTCRKRKRLAQSLGDRAKCVLQVLLAYQPDDVVQDHGLALTLLRLASTSPLVGGELASHDCREQEKQKRDP